MIKIKKVADILKMTHEEYNVAGTITVTRDEEGEIMAVDVDLEKGELPLHTFTESFSEDEKIILTVSCQIPSTPQA